MAQKPPRIVEYERQAEQRAREQDLMTAAQDRMLEAQARIQADADRIAQEQYEMEQYYETEALKHAEEMRVHQAEVRKHEEFMRAHDRKLREHEASMEAFAKVIAMPAKQTRPRQISFMAPSRLPGKDADNAKSLTPSG
ncbi:hypothetical protein DSL72_004852 [Monilinia vaccinii-corymbosi]|uniref:Uncharacterized protein n=1 Tax=Monilinia vaccinii-corymbosi TaxID=61207 RepID=A0A8A3P1K1_9HELO|nr:hypothetical protein DSL72_004852 [Monilinia vaccinii-corymbosi]